MFVFADTMGPWSKRDDIQAVRDRLCDEPTESEASGSAEELGVRPDEGIEWQYTREVSR